MDLTTFTVVSGVTNEQICRLRVFYGAEKPVEAKFQFRWKKEIAETCPPSASRCPPLSDAIAHRD